MNIYKIIKPRRLNQCIMIFAILMLALVSESHAEKGEKRRLVEEAKRKILELTEFSILKGNGRFLFDYGAWIDFRYTNYEDDDNDVSEPDILRKTFEADNRFWLKVNIKPPVDASYDNEHILYFRVKDLYIKRFPEDEGGDYDHEGPLLDYAYTIMDLRPFKVEAGRKYFNVGRGIVYSNVNDGLQINYLKPRWNVGVMASHTLPHEDNIDTSLPGYLKESDRNYFAAGAGYTGIRNHQIYSYYFVQRDFSDEDPIDPDQQYTFNSEYFGLGGTGKLTPRSDYWIELIKQTGTSRVFGTNEENDVDALAANVGVQYQWDAKPNPRLILEYAYGSGDSERTSVTDTLGGNLTGDDNNFLYFGYFPAGYALAPRLSNIHIYRVGASVNPLGRFRLLKDLLFEVDYFRYYKDKSEGGISDTEATANSRDIGSEIDLTVSWQILSDLQWSLSYGHFMPGDAFSGPANDHDNYFSNSLTFTF